MELDSKDEVYLEYEARNQLLQHFSAKSSNQAIIILSFTLAFFAWVQTFQFVENTQNLLLRIIWYVLPLSILFHFTTRALGRLILYGELASAVIRVKMFDINKYRQGVLSTEKVAPKIAMYTDLAATYHIRLWHACDSYMDSHLKATKMLRLVFALTHGEWHPILSLGVGAFIFLLCLFVPWAQIYPN